jgi:hypothetical protein
MIEKLIALAFTGRISGKAQNTTLSLRQLQQLAHATGSIIRGVQ